MLERLLPVGQVFLVDILILLLVKTVKSAVEASPPKLQLAVAKEPLMQLPETVVLVVAVDAAVFNRALGLLGKVMTARWVLPVAEVFTLAELVVVPVVQVGHLTLELKLVHVAELELSFPGLPQLLQLLELYP